MDDDFINKNSLFLPFDDIFNDFIKMDQKITKKFNYIELGRNLIIHILN